MSDKRQLAFAYHSSLVTYHSKNSRRVAGDDGAGGDASGDDRAGADDGARADFESAEDGGVAADGGAAADDRVFERPVRLGLRRAVGARGARPTVVGEHHAVADEDLVFERHALADEGVARNLAARAHPHALLYLDEGADARLVADAAAVEVDEGVELNVAPEFYVRGDAAELARHQRAPPPLPFGPAPAASAPSGTPSSSFE